MSSPSPSNWAPPSWARSHAKHHPLPNRDWQANIAETAGRKGNARYANWISLAQIEQLEMETVRVGIEHIPRPIGYVGGERTQKSHERCFWRELQMVIGASKGQETRYIYVMYHSSGAVHGYPITREELQAKGINL